MALECDPVWVSGSIPDMPLPPISGGATVRKGKTMSVRQRLIIAAFGTIFIITSLLIIAFALTSLKLYRYLIKKG